MSFKTSLYPNNRNEKGLVRPLSVSEKPLPLKGVLCAVKKDFDFLRQKLSLKARGFGFLMSHVYFDDFCFIAGPYFGSPYACALLESLKESGAENILCIGWCGSLDSGLNFGDIIIPSSFENEDSTYQTYILENEDLDFNSPFRKQIKKSLTENSIFFREEKVWTTNSIFRETKKKADFFKNRGAVCVEMENSALYYAANFLNINLICINIVSDLVSEGKWIKGFKSKEFNNSRKKIINWAIDYVKN
ncbi:MAG: hypothetical protein RBR08_09445 [Desulforegulaceae bacterium]|jgi:purine-nucleoside phosphorylase|nr:hypothetical protein [Desulforegulaceae bacterium]